MTDELNAGPAGQTQAPPEGSSGQPEALPPAPWQRTPTRASRRRRDPITQEMIVETALSILDAEGLDGLSMRRIAEELDTGAASLYWHVGSKDGLLDLLFDHVIGEQQVPSPDPERWQEQLKEVARTQRATILRHRDIVAVSLGRIPMGPHALRYSEKVLAILRAGGVPGLAGGGRPAPAHRRRQRIHPRRDVHRARPGRAGRGRRATWRRAAGWRARGRRAGRRRRGPAGISG